MISAVSEWTILSNFFECDCIDMHGLASLSSTELFQNVGIIRCTYIYSVQGGYQEYHNHVYLKPVIAWFHSAICWTTLIYLAEYARLVHSSALYLYIKLPYTNPWYGIFIFSSCKTYRGILQFIGVIALALNYHKIKLLQMNLKWYKSHAIMQSQMNWDMSIRWIPPPSTTASSSLFRTAYNI